MLKYHTNARLNLLVYHYRLPITYTWPIHSLCFYFIHSSSLCLKSIFGLNLAVPDPNEASVPMPTWGWMRLIQALKFKAVGIGSGCVYLVLVCPTGQSSFPSCGTGFCIAWQDQGSSAGNGESAQHMGRIIWQIHGRRYCTNYLMWMTTHGEISLVWYLWVNARRRYSSGVTSFLH